MRKRLYASATNALKGVSAIGTAAALTARQVRPGVVRPKSNHWDSYEESFMIDPTVFEDDGPIWEPSGLLDADGQPIMVMVGGKDPIGFLWHLPNGELRPRDEVIEILSSEGDAP